MHNPLDVSLKLHSDTDGIIWYLDGQELPVCSGSDLREFMQSPRIQQSSLFHVVATPDNTELILEVYLKKHHDPNFRLYICTPLLCHSASERADPEVVLVRSRRFMLASSLGGWHQFGAHDYPSYMLAVQERRGEVSDQSLQILHNHPVWPALSFASSEQHACARLIAVIRDPRWYIDQHHPERTARLEAYLGLTVHNVRMAYSGAAHSYKSRQFNPRCRIVMDCWHRCMESVMQSDPSLQAPGNFVYRVWAKHATTDPIKGQLRAAQTFLRFLRHTWLDSLYHGGDGLFVPEYFFKSESEIGAFKKHMLSEKH